MKTKFLALAFLLAYVASAATYTVKAGGGGDYTTIQACANAMLNGDTCVVYAGTYNEHVTVSAGGAGAYKTLQVNGTDLVYVFDFTLNSHDKVIGFQIQNPSSPHTNDCVAIVNASTDIYITNNTFYACGSHAMISGVNAADTNSYVYIQGNTFSYPCSTSTTPNVCKAISISGDHHLVENNDISHVSDGMSLIGSHNVIRKNTMHDTSATDCGTNSSNCHIDYIEAEPNSATQYNIYEANTELNNLGANGHGFLVQGDLCAGLCSNMIIRYNVGGHVGSGAILDDNAGNSAVAGFSYVKVYNNSFVDYNNFTGNSCSGCASSAHTNNSTNGAEINNIYYYPESISGFFPYYTDSTTNATFSAGSNLAWCTGTCDFHAGIYVNNGAFLSNAPGNQIADPQFVNYAGNDFRLAAGSPALNAGTYLTTVAAGDTGSGTSLIVNDAAYFQDGYGLAGVSGDCIAVTTVSNHVCVTSVNYSTNTLTLAGSITRTAGDHVWLYSDSTGKTVLTGTAPNIGATFTAASRHRMIF